MDKNSPVYLDSSSFAYDDFASQFLYTGASPYNIPLPQASPPLAFSSLNLSGTPDFGSYGSNNGYSTTSPPPTPGQPQRPFTPVDAIPPHVTTAAIHSGSEDGFSSSTKHSRSGRSESPKAISQLVQRREPVRRGSASSTASRLSAKAATRRRPTRDTDDFDSDDDLGDDYTPDNVGFGDAPKSGSRRKEDVRRQRIESEQRRRDELREGYRKLKEVLPSSNQKASKVSLLDRATMHIRYLEITQQQLQARVQQAELETQRLRMVNEKMMLATAEHNQQALAAAAAQANMNQY
jgi:hypothetical protein